MLRIQLASFKAGARRPNFSKRNLVSLASLSYPHTSFPAALSRTFTVSRHGVLPTSSLLATTLPSRASLLRGLYASQSIPPRLIPSVVPVRGYAEASAKFSRAKPHMNIGTIGNLPFKVFKSSLNSLLSRTRRPRQDYSDGCHYQSSLQFGWRQVHELRRN